MLHIECGPDIDARVEELFHVLPAFGMAGTWGVRMRQLIDQDERWLACERAVKIKLAQRDAAVDDGATG